MPEAIKTDFIYTYIYTHIASKILTATLFLIMEIDIQIFDNHELIITAKNHTVSLTKIYRFGRFPFESTKRTFLSPLWRGGKVIPSPRQLRRP